MNPVLIIWISRRDWYIIWALRFTKLTWWSSIWTVWVTFAHALFISKKTQSFWTSNIVHRRWSLWKYLRNLNSLMLSVISRLCIWFIWDLVMCLINGAGFLIWWVNLIVYQWWFLYIVDISKALQYFILMIDCLSQAFLWLIRWYPICFYIF